MYDILITNCRIIDGTGAPWYRADVAIKDGRIVKIGHLCGRPEHKAAETVDGQDRYLAPGFIDIHRSEERGGGKDFKCSCISRWAPSH